MSAAAVGGAVLLALVFVGAALRAATRPTRPAPTVGDLFVAALLAPTGRHHSGMMGPWEPAHRSGGGPRYRGRHCPRRPDPAAPATWPRPAGNLLNDTSCLSSREMSLVLAGR